MNIGNVLNGAIGEIAIYNTVLTATDRSKIESYIALKYGKTLDQAIAQNYLASDGTVIWDAGINLTYKSDVMGIGRDDASSLYQKQSKSINKGVNPIIGLVTIQPTNVANTGTMPDKNFLVLSNNGLSSNLTSPLIGPGGITTTKMSRTWRVTETGNVGIVKFAMPTNLGNGGKVYLVRSVDPVFDNTDTYTELTSQALPNGTYLATDVDLNNGEYLTIATYATAPGGVFKGLQLWTKANSEIPNANLINNFGWGDRSNNGNDFEGVNGTPNVTNGNKLDGINFNPTIQFGGTSYLYNTVGGQMELSNTAQTNIVVAKSTQSAGSVNGFPYDFGGGARAFHYTYSDGNFYNGVGTTDRLGFNTNTGTIVDAKAGVSSITQAGIVLTDYHIFYTHSAASDWKTGFDGGTAAASTTNAVNFTGGEFIGAVAGTIFNGQVPEVISYNSVLSPQDRQRVDSYLATKYGITLSQTTPEDYLDSAGNIFWNSATNASYKSNITAIGRDDLSGLNQKQSKSINASALVTVALGSIATTNALNSNTFSTDKSFFSFGDNAGSLAWTSTGAPVNRRILSKVYKVQSTGSIPALLFQVPDNSSTLAVGSKLQAEVNIVYMLVDADGDFSSGATEIAMTLNGTDWETTQTLPDGQFFTFATQTTLGPGGVSLGNTLWIRADGNITDPGTSVTSWKSESADLNYGLEMNGTKAGNPDLQSNLFNFNPGVKFFGTDYFRIGGQGIIQSGATSGEVFSMLNTTANHTTASGFPYQFGGAAVNTFQYDFNNSNIYDGTGSTTRYNWNPLTGTPSRDVQIPMIYNTFSAPSVWVAFFNGISSFSSATNTVNFTTSADNNSYIGASASSVFIGNIGEIITYNRGLSSNERTRVYSYLATKYGQTLGTNTNPYNYIASDGTTIYWNSSNTYQNDIVAMGRDDGTVLNQKQSRSTSLTGLIVVGNGGVIAADNASNPNNFPLDKTFEVIGSDTANASAWTTTESSNSLTRQRIAREWKVQETGVVGAIHILIPDDSSTTTVKLPKETGVVYISQDADGDFTSGSTETALTLNGTNWEGNIDFANGQFFTFATQLPNIVTSSTITIPETGSGTITASLAAQPVSNVTLSVTSSNTAAGTVSPTTLTFTPANWNTPQTVTVSGVIDANPTNENLNVTFAVQAGSSAEYLPVASRAVPVVVTDIGFTIVTVDNLTSEAGDPGSFTIVMNSQPTSNVTLALSSDNVGEGTVQPSVTFTPANWNVVQTITVNGINDPVPISDGTVAYNIITGSVTSADPNWIALLATNIVDVAMQNQNDDAPGVVVTTTDNSTDENGATATVQFTLLAQPVGGANVTIPISLDDATEGTLGGVTSITILNANWNNPSANSVTITGVDDLIVDGTIAYHLVTGKPTSTDPAYNGLLATDVADVTLNNFDNDIPSVKLVESGGSTTVTEGGATDTYTAVLTTLPAANVVVTITAGTQATTSPSSLTFTTANWNIPQTVTVTAVDDTNIDPGQNQIITHTVTSTDPVYNALAVNSINVVVTDNDIAGFTITPSTDLAVTEGITNPSAYQVVLTAAPSSNVKINISDSSNSISTLTPSIIFTNANWNIPQSVSITADEEPNLINEQDQLVTFSIDDANSDDAFDPLSDQTRKVDVTDNDTATIVISPTAITVNENLGTGTFTVVLGAQPSSNVVIDLSSSNTAEATISPSALTFTSANWNVPQTITITGVDDNIDRNDSASINISVNDVLSDDNFDPLPDQSVAVTLTNDDHAGYTLTPASDFPITEGQTANAYQIVLNSQPTSNVVISASESSNAITLGSTTFTFTPANWNVSQNVSVTADEDANLVSEQDQVITFSVVDASSDNSYDPLPDQIRQVDITDNDAASFIVSQTTLTINENAGTGTFTVVLGAQPTTDVVFDISSSSTSDATISPTTLTFTSSNWNAPQTITVTGIDDLIDRSDTDSINVTVNDAASDDNFDSLLDQNVAITLTNDDHVGFTLTPTTDVSITEGQTSNAYQLVLTSQPTSNVVISASESSSSISLATSNFTFTPANWNIPQNISVTADEDANIVSEQNQQITFSIVDASSDDTFDPLADQIRNIDVVDNDVAGFTVTPTTDVSINEGDNLPIAFQVVLTAQPTSNVIVDITSLSAELTIVTTSLTFTPQNWNVAQIVSITAIEDANIVSEQDQQLTFVVNNSGSDATFASVPSQSRKMDIVDNDLAEFIVSVSNVTIGENSGTGTFTVELTAEPTTNVVFDISTLSATDLTVSPTTLTFTPGGWNIPQTITITGIDDKVDKNDSTIVKVSINTASSDDNFDPVADQFVSVTLTNDDIAGITISPVADLPILEGGTNASAYSVVLNSQPTANVTITPSANSPLTVNTPAMTFTPFNWNVPQNLSVSAVEDVNLVSEQDQVVTFTPSSADPKYNSAAIGRNMDITDNDVPSIFISASTLVVPENGGTNTFTIVLGAQPTTDVTIDLSHGGNTESTFSPFFMTFTSTNWNVPQTVTVTGVDDNIDRADVDNISVVVFSGSDPVYAALPPQVVHIDLTNDDHAGFTITPNSDVSLGEGVSSNTHQVVLTSQPLSNVELSIASDPLLVVNTPTLTFTPQNWNLPQNVNITAVQDSNLISEQDNLLTFSIVDGSSDNTFDPLPDQTRKVDIVDDDVAGFTVTPTTDVSIIEGSTLSTSFQVVLTAQPISDVIVDISSTSIPLNVNTTSLVFTMTNWNVPQNVSVSAIEDTNLISEQDQVVKFSINDIGSDNAFDTLADITRQMDVIDNDVASLIVSKTSMTIAENAGTGTVTVVLGAQPTSNVIVDLSSNTIGDVSISPSTITFTSSNWNVPQIITITGIDDKVDNNDLSILKIGVNVANSDPAYSTAIDKIVNISLTNDDSVGITIAPTQDLDILEGTNNPTAYGVTLNTQPLTNVIIDIISNVNGINIVTGTLTFTPQNWNIPQNVSVSAENNPTLTPKFGTISFKVDKTNSDSKYGTLSDQIRNVTVTDKPDLDKDGIPDDNDPDIDGDGILNTVEDASFNNGDGNGDGIKDSIEVDVASIANSATGGSTTMQVSGDCLVIDGYNITLEVSQTIQDQDFDYPLGLNGFAVKCTTPGSTTNVSFIYNKIYDTTKWTWRKLKNNVYFDISSRVTYSTKSIGGVDVTTATIQFKDGGDLDVDGIADGKISDPSGPAVNVAVVTSSSSSSAVSTTTTTNPIANTGNGYWMYLLLGIGMMLTCLTISKLPIPPQSHL